LNCEKLGRHLFYTGNALELYLLVNTSTHARAPVEWFRFAVASACLPSCERQNAPNMSNKPSALSALGISFALPIFLLFGCVTGKKMHQVSPGMTQSEVIRILGKPDGFRHANDYEWFRYSNRLATRWSWDRADYNVIFKNGRVIEYGAGKVRVKENAVVIVPLVVR
jgi:hypothetical protein